MTFIAQVIGIGSSVLPYGELKLSRFSDPEIDLTTFAIGVEERCHDWN